MGFKGDTVIDRKGSRIGHLDGLLSDVRRGARKPTADFWRVEEHSRLGGLPPKMIARLLCVS